MVSRTVGGVKGQAFGLITNLQAIEFSKMDYHVTVGRNFLKTGKLAEAVTFQMEVGFQYLPLLLGSSWLSQPQLPPS